METDWNDAVTAKAVAMCCLFCFSMAVGSLPIKLSQWLKWTSDIKSNIYVQLLLCLGGGVLLCTTFLHMLPEVAENCKELPGFEKTSIPIAELLMCIGFFLMYLVEECVHVYLHKKENFETLKSARSSTAISHRSLSFINSKEILVNIENPKECNDHVDHSHVDHSHIIIERNSTIVTIRGLLIVLALSIHELFEGLAVGLEDSPSHVWYMFGGVSAHKFVIAFCIGVELVTSGMKILFCVIYIFTFAIVSPLGIGIGILVSVGEKDVTDVVSVILQGIASGTLLYVVFFEILKQERKSGLKQYFAILVGFLIMLGITLIGDVEH